MQSRFHHQYYSVKRNSRNGWRRWLGAGIGMMALVVLVYQVPFVNDRLSWRIDNLRTRIVYFFNPPDEVVFVPQGQLTAEALPGAATSIVTSSPQAGVTSTPTATEVPLPESVNLDGVVYVDQHNRWNYCGPANLTMALNYWGWAGDRDDVGAYVKPGIFNADSGKEDKNVMPYEMEDFVDSQVPGMQAVVRVGGELETVKKLITAGFPVVVEKGYYERDYTGKIGWLGHYLFVTGYDDPGGYFIVQDAYLRTGADGTGANLHSSYAEFTEQWRSFNFLFMVVYPEEKLDELLVALGPWADEGWANARALEIARADVQTLSGNDLYFAWFNVGSSHVRLQQYVDAASAYDHAFGVIYPSLGDDNTQRPYRMMWYQTGPYWAYYYSGRYGDVIALADDTLRTVDTPTLEESIYWRGMARLAIGETGNAIADFQQAVRINPNFWVGIQQLQALGVSG